MFHKVLIANRGEIACRITRTLQQMGIRAVAVYSDADRDASHVCQADEAYALGGQSAAESYLRGEKIVEVARACGADAIHPGYGFLSENAGFAEACAAAKIVFIGPNPGAIRAMGDKTVAKSIMTKAGVPVVPGWVGAADIAPEKLRAEADRVGYPLLVKAAAGGGGKGMRRVHTSAELDESVAAAAREARSAFADGRIFLERYIAKPRHIEFQIFGDSTGNVIHLFERECSIQRRYQKIVEETPSVALTPPIRSAMQTAAVNAGKAIGYTNAGTVEFLLAPDNSFYFLEVNTRLQVEHPVTEMTLQTDLVRAQLLVAAGQPLPFDSGLVPRGHAIECRIYAEDPNTSLPSIGPIRVFMPPIGPNIRVDTGVAAGSEITVHYDPMIAKLVTWGSTREESVSRMAWALDHFVILGVRTNIPLLQKIVAHPEFRAGRIHTHFLTDHPIVLDAAVPREAAIAGAWVAGNGRSFSPKQSDRGRIGTSDGCYESTGPWAGLDTWRAF